MEFQVKVFRIKRENYGTHYLYVCQKNGSVVGDGEKKWAETIKEIEKLKFYEVPKLVDYKSSSDESEENDNVEN